MRNVEGHGFGRRRRFFYRSQHNFKSFRNKFGISHVCIQLIKRQIQDFANDILYYN